MPRIAGLLIVVALVQGVSAGSTPLTADQARILEQVRSYAVAYTQELPNFICTQVTSREVTRPSAGFQEETGAGAQFGPSDQITEKVTFFNQKEGYEVIAINGKKVAGAKHNQLTGAVSIGEFGSTLLQIFNPRSHTVFAWNRKTTLRGHRVNVFGFQVPKEAGTLVTDETTNEKVVAPYGGLIFADAETHEVLRIVSHLNLPSGFPIDRAERVVEYRPANIAGKSYNLPFHSEVQMQSGLNLYVNKIDFKDYRKFTVEATIRLGDFADLESPESKPAPDRTPTASPVEDPDRASQPGVEKAASPIDSKASSVAPPEPIGAPARPATAQPAPANLAEVAPAAAPPAPETPVPEHAGAVTPKPEATPEPSSAPEPSSDSTYRLELRTDLVLVPVVVRDAKGGSIGNLAKENFEIFDKGKREEIASFTMETRNTQAMGSGSAAKAQSGADGRPAAGSSATYTVYFFDDAHIEVGELAMARDAVLREINDLPVTDRAAIITTSGMVQLSFTNDPVKLKDALMKLRTQPMGNESEKCPTITYYTADLILQGFRDAMASATQELILCQSLTPQQAKAAPNMVMDAAIRVASAGERKSRSALLQLDNVIRWISKAPGNRRIILISPGFIVTDRARTDEANLIEQAIRSEVLINALDANGVSALAGTGDAEDRS
ncbi:MAG: VWA domain-containing protein, partial [Terracidiphilus sp.]